MYRPGGVWDSRDVGRQMCTCMSFTPGSVSHPAARHVQIHTSTSLPLPIHTWLRILAVRLNIIAACLGEDDVIAEVGHLHELVVEDLVLAGLAGDVVLLLLGGEARAAPAGDV